MSTYTSLLIRFEESLLDFNQLDRIDVCPLMPITDEIQLCQFILQSPVMINLYTWLQWPYFFEPKYGSLKFFLKKHKDSLQQLLLLLETINYINFHFIKTPCLLPVYNQGVDTIDCCDWLVKL